MMPPMSHKSSSTDEAAEGRVERADQQRVVDDEAPDLVEVRRVEPSCSQKVITCGQQVQARNTIDACVARQAAQARARTSGAGVHVAHASEHASRRSMQRPRCGCRNKQPQLAGSSGARAVLYARAVRKKKPAPVSGHDVRHYVEGSRKHEPAQVVSQRRREASGAGWRSLWQRL